MLQRYQKLYNQAIIKKSNLELLQQQYDQLQQEHTQTVKELTDIIHKQQSFDQAISLLKLLMDGLSSEHIQHLSNLLNTTLATIFYDRKYSLELHTEQQRNQNVLQLFLHEQNPDGTEVITSINDNGYGVQSVIGFTLQVYYILYNKLQPILFLDEAFGNLSSDYLPYLKSLLNSLTQRYNFRFILITHDQRLENLSDHSYRVVQGTVTPIQ